MEEYELIRAVNVTKQFEDIVAVDDVTLEVPKGTILSMVGPNGAGKTPLVRMILYCLLGILASVAKRSEK